jgi:hypothetical protein
VEEREKESRERERQREVCSYSCSIYRIQPPSLFISLLELGEEHALESPHFSS